MVFIDILDESCLYVNLADKLWISKFLHGDLYPGSKARRYPPVSGREGKGNLLVVCKAMLSWLPEERNTAGELMEHTAMSRYTHHIYFQITCNIHILTPY
jgi:hypothetical protein